MENKEIKFIKSLFYSLGRKEKLSILSSSNLTDREKIILQSRLIEGLSVKETSEHLNMEVDAFNKSYHKTMIKLYKWLERQAIIQNVNLKNLELEFMV